jgi:hypothetical protein
MDPNVVAERHWKFKQALANSMHEGFEPTPKYLAMCDQVALGELTFEQARERILPERELGPKLLVYEGDDGSWYWFVQDDEGEKVDSRGGFPDEAGARRAGQAAFDSYHLACAA